MLPACACRSGTRATLLHSLATLDRACSALTSADPDPSPARLPCLPDLRSTARHAESILFNRTGFPFRRYSSDVDPITFEADIIALLGA